MAAPPVVDVGGDLTSTSGVVVDASGTRWIYLWTFSKNGDYDLLWIPLIKIAGAPIAAYIDTVRAAPLEAGRLMGSAGSGTQQHIGKWIWIGTGGTSSTDLHGLGQLVDLSCAKISGDTNSPYTFRIVCGTSRLLMSVGVPDSPSPFLSAMYYEDSRQPVIPSETLTPPGIANQLSKLANRALGVPLMFNT